MTIRAVDIVSIVPRLNEAGRAQHQSEVQNLAGQHLQAAMQQNRAEKAQHQVVQTPSSGEVAIRKDDSRKKGGGGSRRRQEPGGAGSVQEEQAKPAAGHKLDIKV